MIAKAVIYLLQAGALGMYFYSNSFKTMPYVSNAIFAIAGGLFTALGIIEIVKYIKKWRV